MNEHRDTSCKTYGGNKKPRKLTVFKNQVLNDLEQNERIILHKFNCKVGKIHVYVCLVVLFVFFGGERLAAP